MSPATAAETQFDTVLRPRTLDEFKGQDQVTENLRVYISAARSRNEAMDHTLLYGPSGLGKTTLSYITGNELGTETLVIAGPSIKDRGDVRGIATRLTDKMVLFIDEIHGINSRAEEIFYDLLDEFKLRIPLGKGASARVLERNVAHFTCIGATTRPGKLTEALRSRFRITLELKPYDVEHLATIVERSSRLLNNTIEHEAALDIALCARGVPRRANNLLRRARDYAQIFDNGNITAAGTRESMEMMGIDRKGLEEADRRILQLLEEKAEPIGLKAMATTLNMDVDTIEKVCEPHLLRLGFVERGSRGRTITNAALNYLAGRD